MRAGGRSSTWRRIGTVARARIVSRASTVTGPACVWSTHVSASLAAGPYDGVWSVVQSSPTKGSSTFFLSIHEDDGALMSAGFNIVVFALNLDDTWGYGLGVQTN